MENDPLKSAWHNIATPQKNDAELTSILKESAHPVLKEIRRQLLFETVAFSLFLLVYYDFFDGDRKPLYANLLLVGVLLLVIGHNVAGYLIARRGITGSNIRQALTNRLSGMKTYAFVSVTLRVLSAAGLWFFFISVMDLDAHRYGLLALGMVIVSVQVFFLSRIWAGRIKRMKEAIAGF
ncbi:hypothetical protein GCM10023091_16470 [Ravibacter arvi]|uniref:RDD domain-containing protein n=1 Tax=Ravibacter arvi TaxID=2051041 RepID=A0ABP8LWJ1_9BACT